MSPAQSHNAVRDVFQIVGIPEFLGPHSGTASEYASGVCVHFMPTIAMGRHPRPTYGIVVAITVMNRTFAASGRPAM